MTHHGEIPANLKGDPVCATIYKRVHRQDRNALICVVGSTGSRKSGSSTTMAANIDPKFNINRIVFTAHDFLTLIDRGEPVPGNPGKFRKLTKGSCIIWDETGVDNDNTQWFTLKARAIKQVFTLFRYRNLVVFLTSPNLSMIQVGIRRLLHGALVMKGIPADSRFPASSFAEGDFFWMDENAITGKVYYKRPRFNDLDGYPCTLDPYIIPRPEKKLEDEYKDKKDYFSNIWFKIVAKEIDFLKERLGEKEKDSNGVSVFEDLKKSILDNRMNFILERAGKKTFNQHLIAGHFRINPRIAQRVAAGLNAELSKGLILLPDVS